MAWALLILTVLAAIVPILIRNIARAGRRKEQLLPRSAGLRWSPWARSGIEGHAGHPAAPGAPSEPHAGPGTMVQIASAPDPAAYLRWM